MNEHPLARGLVGQTIHIDSPGHLTALVLGVGADSNDPNWVYLWYRSDRLNTVGGMVNTCHVYAATIQIVDPSHPQSKGSK